jgi:hypothetical protein
MVHGPCGAHNPSKFLTAFFEFNSPNPDLFITYNLSKKRTWVAKHKTWKLRKAIDRASIIKPVMQYLYFLRTLMSSNHSAGKGHF